MSAELTEINGHVLTIRVTGRLTQAELAASQRAAGVEIERLGKARLLIVVQDFEGMAKDGNWGDVSFQLNHDDAIERIAIVSNPNWKDVALMFTGKGVRRMPIEHFASEDFSKARAWVSAS